MSPFIVVDRRTGRERILEEGEIVADGETLRVPLSMMDSTQRAVFESVRRTADTRARVHDARERAYLDRQVDDENAWRRPDGAYPLSAGENSICTTNDGRPGHLQRADDGPWLVCKADAAASASSAKARADARLVDRRAVVEAAYEEVRLRDCSAWQRPIRPGVTQ
jgi:hypothetical protein